MEFASGVSQQALTIGIVDDEVPELSEVFCIRLILPEGGAVLGDIVEGNYISVHPLHTCQMISPVV